MFQVGDRVVYGNHGVCEVIRIDTLDLSGVDQTRQYYYLAPMLDGSSVVYAPVDNPKIAIRAVMTRDDIEELIHEIPQIPELEVISDKVRENVYKDCVRGLDGSEWIRLLKTVRARGAERIARGKKMTALDERYMKLAQMQLGSEIAAVLAIPREEADDMLEQSLAQA